MVIITEYELLEKLEKKGVFLSEGRAELLSRIVKGIGSYRRGDTGTNLKAESGVSPERWIG
jgi:hypothetical protein